MWIKEQEEQLRKLREADGCQLNFWYEIKTQTDIDFLLEHFGGFHDSAIVRSEYKDDRWLEDGSFTLDPEKVVVSLFFKSQWVDPELELKFVGMRRMNLSGYQKNYSPEMLDCYLSFYEEKIIFADDYYFEPQKQADDKLLNEPMTTFIVADKLFWRFKA